ncbi:type II toxin-antitoxin system RelE/ParE family toxin [Fulvivirgaceae bacterium BMA12]|uniref:Type II toxin-antitoxin system RelE/ParE family toxin n=1 Tax=Agaribacillus aureus TaxID=3051825 RepID=A0ABT8L5J8_9BACT|nr:type II toxin-antitoxin system RelE/ParE family toxin [Fulvivirgaceae bacterium BMA12]
MAIVKLTPLAEEDLFEIWYYIAVEKKSRLNADRFIDKLDKEFYKLAKTPRMGTERSVYVPGLKGWPFGEYVIFYRPIPRGVDIIRVIHAKREKELLKYQ